MDGYAVKAADIAVASASSPVYLDIIGESKAGTSSDTTVKAHTTVRIMTGATLPKGADTVVPFEETDETQRKDQPLKQIGILKAVEKGKHIRSAGEDIAKGQLALPKGTALRPAEIGVLASLGLKKVKVIRRPVVAILATGDELVELGKPLTEGQIYNSNSYSAAAQVLRYGGIPRVLGIAKDTESDLEAKIKEALTADMLLTTGGVSMGDYDLVKDVLAKQGEISFWKVRMKPGKPLAFGTIKGVPHLGLPGNPVSSMITFELFARPAILKMMGKTKLDKPTVEAVMEDHAKNTDSRRIFLRARVRKEGGRYYARTTGPQGSGILTSMSQANALVIVPENVKVVKEGDLVKAIMLDWNEE
jgi:molybdopterin molybdotransferase